MSSVNTRNGWPARDAMSINTTSSAPLNEIVTFGLYSRSAIVTVSAGCRSVEISREVIEPLHIDRHRDLRLLLAAPGKPERAQRALTFASAVLRFSTSSRLLLTKGLDKVKCTLFAPCEVTDLR